ncbi:ribonuclease III [Endozoicomonas sp. G2_2]|uniref:ribonuclease III n=1 Tax=Endozoicomonas sp. G2_2 TaxID=2821092 RepID=UPI001ADA717F|nr:ribonuclease III [Endozoicomonas sp. G2_2]MBO9471565.1 ribonuclease III [Endozoicomonas sp. G2_2]
MADSAENRSHARATLEARLGYVFEDRSLLDRALTHRSAAADHNERLEFLGDGVLNFVVAAALFAQCPEAPEGDLSRLRAALVRERTLAQIADEIELGQAIVLGPGELRNGSRRRASILADGVEALLGAIFQEGGFDAARGVIAHLYAERLANLPSAASLKDAKTRLQEWLQARARNRPEYELVRVTGADHCQHFVSRCVLADTGLAVEGEGGGRRKAEQDAARRMLEMLDDDATDTDTAVIKDAPQ